MTTTQIIAACILFVFLLGWAVRQVRRRRTPTIAMTPARTSLGELRRRVRILVIDDSPDDFPFTILRDEGYAIDHWPEVKDLSRLEEGAYDILVLDIGGVGRTVSPATEGLGVLDHIKKRNPAQIVVAYSGQSHKPELIGFFRLADDYVSKPSTALIWKQKLDTIIESKVTARHYWESLRTILASKGVPQSQIESLERRIVEATQAGSTDATKAAADLVSMLDNAGTVLSIISKILRLFAA